MSVNMAVEVADLPGKPVIGSHQESRSQNLLYFVVKSVAISSLESKVWVSSFLLGLMDML